MTLWKEVYHEQGVKVLREPFSLKCQECSNYLKPIEVVDGVVTVAICKVSRCRWKKRFEAIEFIKEKEMQIC